MNEILERLVRIEEKLDALLAQVEEIEGDSDQEPVGVYLEKRHRARRDA